MFASAASRPPNKRLRLAGAVVLLVCGGCASRDAILLPEIDSFETRTAVLGALRDWQFSGRVAVSAGEEGFNGKLRWVQLDDRFESSVSGPLGIGTVRIEGDNDHMTLTDKDGVRTALADVESELRYRYGWTIPVRSLRYWALGIPDPRFPADTDFDANGQLVRLAQRNWTVSIPRYRDGGGQAMPKLLSAENTDTRVRIVIDKWQFFD